MSKFFQFFLLGLFFMNTNGSLGQHEPQINLLIFSKTAGFRHESIETGVKALRELCSQNGIEVTHTEDARWFTKKRLKKFDAVLFLSTSGDVFNKKRQRAFKRFIHGGGGFIGIHAASTTEYDWPWYGQLLGAYFDGHPEAQDAVVRVTDPSHLATTHLPKKWKRFDEWYNFRWIDKSFHTLLTVDESTYTGGKHQNNHPIAWCKEFNGSKVFYTALGHTKESYTEKQFLKHLLGGIKWVMGLENLKPDN
ncbi:ThuA domain-containing protein [Sediminicola luteus]|uniref:ThuA-like domain-containing protein n=1 Tax=Sediminicola luteus TaxID=319238 RepID=A0A2A4G643_9FLAO|nr:ThuA domain-containing protein [Sediminicola luteus]PCE64439.1 hypothetical protein B7P33_09125 [Sediminicola luteus]